MEGKSYGLVFVCTGNPAGSLMGEGLLNPMRSRHGSMSDAELENALADISRR